MRLRRLDLTRYGMFSGGSVDFGEAREGLADLHIIHGPNEAGKTTLVAAYLDLLYGIETTKYAFLHQNTMQVGGALEIGGRLNEFIRIRQSSGSLLDGQNRPVPDIAIRAELGGIERDGYRNMFSLDDDSLEKGGDEILNSRGDLGKLLFSASTGLAELSDQLGKIRAEADTFYKFHGRQTRLAQFKDDLAKLKAERERIDTQAARFAELKAARSEAEDRYRAAVEARGKTQVELRNAERRLAALPLLARLRSIRAQLVPLESLPDAPEAWAEELPRLIQDDLRLEGRLEICAARIRELEDAIAGRTLDAAALAIAGRMETLSLLRARHIAAEEDIPRLDGEDTDAEAKIMAILTAIGRSGEADRNRLVLEASTVGTLRALMEQRSGIVTALATAADELEEAEAALADASDRLREAGGNAAAPSAEGEAALAALLGAQAIARNVEQSGRLRSAKRLWEAAREAFAVSLGELKPWDGTAESLEGMAVPGKDTVEGWKRDLEDIRKKIDRHAGEVETLTTDMRRLAADGKTISQSSGVIGDAAAGTLRAARDDAWARHRSSLDEPTAEAFESALRRDDAAVAARLSHAGELAELRQTARELASREAQSQRAAELLQEAESRRVEIVGEIAAAAGRLDSRLAEIAAGQLEAWLARRDKVLDAWRKLRPVEAELNEARQESRQAAARLASALAAAGTAASAEAGFPELLAAADLAIALETRLGQLRDRVAAGQNDLRQRKRAHDKRLAEEAAWTRSWEAACGGCWLGEAAATPALDAVRAILEAIAELGPALAGKAGLRRRIDGMERDRKAHGDLVAALAGELGLATADDPLALGGLIAERVSEAGLVKTLRDEAERDLAKEQSQKRLLDGEQQALAKAKAKMTDFFGAASLEEVAARLNALATRRELAGQLAGAREEICRTLGVQDAGQAEAGLDALDQAGLDLERDALDRRFHEEDLACQELHTAFRKAAEALEAVGGDSQAAEIEEKRRTVLLELEDGARHYLRLRLGSAATELALASYREQHRSSMLENASEAFSTISRGAYARLEAQRRKEKEILVAIPSAGGSKEADHLSKGTRFQLYLALRVSGYREFVRSRPPVPFVSDDIMETFDDFRAEQAFRLLAEMARLGQVIYLTHHPHLCAIAGKVCPEARIHHLRPSVVPASGC